MAPTLKEFGLTSDDLKEFAPTVKQFLDAQKKGAFKPQNINQGASTGQNAALDLREGISNIEETSYPGDNASEQGDPVLETLYEAMADARDKKRYDKAVEIARQIKRVEAGMGGGRPTKTEKEPAPSASTRLDITNLAPHADEIGKELMGMVADWGFKLPEGWADQGAALIAATIKSRPNIIKDGLQTFDRIIKRYAGVQQAEAKEEGQFDPTRPWEWAKKAGFD